MFKKSLVAVAALATFSAGAMAANVELYGVVDMGFSYTHTSHQEKGDKFEMSQNMYAGSRFGFRGTEDLGDDLTVGFILENGFTPDTGAMAVSLGWYWDLEPFETGYIDAGVQASQVNVWRLNSNTVYYVSPVFAGFKVGAQYSMTGAADPDVQEDSRWSENNNFGNVALRWDGANARAILGVEWDKYGKEEQGKRDDAWSVKLAGAWVPNGGPFTLYAGASWYKNQDRFSDSTYDDDGFLNNKYDDSGKRLDGENKGALADAEETDYKRYIASVGCHYYFSKRTMLYTIASFADGDGIFDTVKHDDGGGAKSDRFMAHVGITHFF